MMIMTIVVRLGTALGGKIVVCQPGSREVAKSFEKKAKIKPHTTKNVTIPDMNLNNSLRPFIINLIYRNGRDAPTIVGASLRSIISIAS